MGERNFFVVAGNKKMTKLTGMEQAHIISSDNGYTVKNVLSSNTFIIKSGEKYTKAKYILDLVENPLDLEAVYDWLPFSSIWNTSHAVNIQQKFYLGDNQIRMIEKELKLLKINGEHTKINYEDTTKVVCYMNSIKGCSDFHSKMDIYPSNVKSWALNNFKGDCAEIGLYCLLDCCEKNRLSTFLEFWKKLTLGKADIDELTEYVKNVFIPERHRIELLKYLQELKR